MVGYGWTMGHRMYRRVGSVLAALVMVGAVATAASAGDGDPDPSFSGDGVDEPFSTYSKARGAAIGGDGRIVVAGNGWSNELMLARYLPDGSHDVSFGDGGLVEMPNAIEVSDVAIDEEGRITLSGTQLSTLTVARLLKDGSLDASFSGDGLAMPIVGDSSRGNAVTVDAGGRVVVVGSSGTSENRDWVVVRYLPDGSLDSTFATDGVLVVDAARYESAEDVAIDPQGRIVVVGSIGSFWNDSSLLVMRLRSDGSLDPSFGAGGVVSEAVSGESWGMAVVLDDLGRIVVAGAAGEYGTEFSDIKTYRDVLVVRYLSDGGHDPSFSDDGIVTTDATQLVLDQPTAVSIDLVGNIVVGGNSADNSGVGAGSGLLIRYLPDGSLDTTFSGDGIVSETPWEFRVNDLVVDDMGDIVTAGTYGFFGSPVGFVSAPSPVDPQFDNGMVVARFEGAGWFRDDADSVFENDINSIAALGITRGCNPPANTNYCPDGHVTRGQMAAFLKRTLDLPPTEVDAFVDDDDSVFEDDINRLAAAGITKGCNPPANDAFCPERKVTREQMAAFLTRAFGYADDGDGDLFTDDDSSIFEADIDKLATAGVTKGCNPPVNDRFCPTQNVTRGQMAAFLHRALS